MQSLTFALSAAVALFAALQWRVYHNQLRFQLYSRRYEIYLAVKEFLAQIVKRYDVTADEPMVLLQRTRDHEFLFPPSVGKYLHSVYDKAVEFNFVLAASKPLEANSPELHANVDEQSRLFKWFEGELKEGAFATFLPFLDFRNVGGRWAR